MRKILVLAMILFTVCAQGQNSPIRFSGYLEYSFDATAKKGTAKIPRVQNDRNGGTSGTLYLQVWLVDKKYYGDTRIEGFKLTRQRIGELKGGYYYHDLVYDYTWEKHVPAGDYYVVYQLLEYDPKGATEYVLCDYLCFEKQVNVPFEEDEDW